VKKNPLFFCVEENVLDGDTGKVTGWGRAEFQQVRPILRESSVGIISNQMCRKKWFSIVDNKELIKSTVVCAQGLNANVSTCNGDSGNPLVVQRNGKWHLIGVSSFGSLRGCSIPGIPSVFTRISSFLDWIAVNMAKP